MPSSTLIIYIVLLAAISGIGSIIYNTAAAIRHNIDGLNENRLTPPEQTATTPENDSDTRTRVLIGDTRYHQMADIVKEVLASHRNDCAMSVSLASGPSSDDGVFTLHHLLPGDELFLLRHDREDLPGVDVYRLGIMVGTILFGDAENVEFVMRERCVTGAYVAEQNCYGDSTDVNLGIVVYHRNREPGDFTQPIPVKDMEFIALAEGPHPMLLFQN